MPRGIRVIGYGNTNVLGDIAVTVAFAVAVGRKIINTNILQILHFLLFTLSKFLDWYLKALSLKTL